MIDHDSAPTVDRETRVRGPLAVVSADCAYADRLAQVEQELQDALAALAAVRAELDRTQAEARNAQYMATHDALTSLPNSVFFRQRLEQSLSRAEPESPLAVLYLDLDGFKRRNDDHGHHVGDEILRIIAARLTHAVRAEDMVGRLGGDEFVCLLAGWTRREQILHLANKLVDLIAAPLKIGSLEVSVRASIGIATHPGDADTTDAILQSADLAMYHAKRRKLGVAFFDECRARREA